MSRARAGRPRAVWGALLCASLAAATAATAAAAPREAPVTAPALFERIERGAFAEAESLALGALAAHPPPRDSAAIIDALVMARWRNDRESAPGTFALAERSLALRESRPGRDSLELAWSLETLAYARIAAGRTDEARALATRALALRKRRLPADHPDLTRLIHQLGSLAYRGRDYREALARYGEALALREGARPLRVVDVARSRMARAATLVAMGDEVSAVPELERAARELEPTPGRDLLYALNTLASVQGRLDLHSEAAATARRALELAERLLGPEHLQTGYAYRSLGYIGVLEGDYPAARDAYQKAAGILERALGPDDANAVNMRRLLITQLNKSGDFGAARDAASRELARAEARPVPDSLALVGLLNSMAYATEFLGRPADATALYERALAIAAAAGPDSPAMAFQITNLAGNYIDVGKPARAESLLLRARAIYERTPRENSSSQVSVLRGLAQTRMEHGDFVAADSLLDHALAIIETRLAGRVPEATLAWRDRAILKAAAGERSAALVAALRSDSLGWEHQRLLTQGMAEREALNFAAARQTGLPVALTLAADRRGLGDAERRAVWDAVIRNRAQVLDEMAARTQSEHQADPEVAALAAAWRGARERLAALEVRGAGSNPERFAAELAERRRAAEQAEVALARRSAAFRRAGERADAGFAQVSAALPPDATLVAYVRYVEVRGNPRPGGPQSYLAFVLPAAGAPPEVIPLGGAGELDSLVERWDAVIGRPLPAERGAARRAAREVRLRGEALRRWVWDPVSARLGRASLVLVVPDGALHRVPLAALPEGRDRWLLETGPTLHLLAAERDLVAPAAGPDRGGMLAVGDPGFDLAEPAPLLAAATAASGPLYRGPRAQCAEFGRLRFPPLPGSREEARALLDLWERAAGAGQEAADALLEGEAATESALKAQCGGRRVLHLATHGFFLDARCAAGEAAAGTRGLGALAPWDAPAAAPTASAPAGNAARPAAALENPLLLSGLALAGANRRDSLGAGGEDGILTAEEVASLDLSGTHWAVLSACRTGTGPIAAGEGVLGLRRAFQVAGARTVIASLWPVGDAGTRRWMEALYRGRFVEGRSTAEAVRAASLEVLRAQRAAGASETPWEWAAFQAAGDWR